MWWDMADGGGLDIWILKVIECQPVEMWGKMCGQGQEDLERVCEKISRNSLGCSLNGQCEGMCGGASYRGKRLNLALCEGTDWRFKYKWWWGWWGENRPVASGGARGANGPPWPQPWPPLAPALAPPGPSPVAPPGPSTWPPLALALAPPVPPLCPRDLIPGPPGRRDDGKIEKFIWYTPVKSDENRRILPPPRI